MKNKKGYPLIEEEDGSIMIASEPSPVAVISSSRDTEKSDEGYNPEYGFAPLGFPHTIKELEQDLLEAEEERNDSSKWCSSEEMWADIKKTFPWANIR